LNVDKTTFCIATRSSALALVQANWVLDRCQARMPDARFDLRTFKTTGDLQLGVSLTESGKSLPKGLFTKELEVALLAGDADLAVHSLKDLPTELPDGLELLAACEREDVRDVLVTRHAVSGTAQLPERATVATSSTRRRLQLLAVRPDLNVIEIRGNVGTRLRKLAERGDLHATLLAAAGLKRLGYTIGADGVLLGKDVPSGLRATLLGVDEMMPAVGQAALGIESRAGDSALVAVRDVLNHAPTFHAVTAERAFLRAMGGGCLAPIAALADVRGETVELRAVWFPNPSDASDARRISGSAPVAQARLLGERLARELKGDAHGHH